MDLYLILILSIIVLFGDTVNITRFRGTMIQTNITEENFRVLASWNANHIRWQLLWSGFPHGPADKGDVPAYEAWLETALQHVDSLIAVCREL
jgi:hypothetical protein